MVTVRADRYGGSPSRPTDASPVGLPPGPNSLKKRGLNRLLREPLAGTTVQTLPGTLGHLPAWFSQFRCMNRRGELGTICAVFCLTSEGSLVRGDRAGGRPSQGGELWQGSCLVSATTIATMLEQHNVRCGFRQITRAVCATSEFPGAAAHVREHYVRGRRPSRGDRPVADHQQTLPSRSTAVSCAQ